MLTSNVRLKSRKWCVLGGQGNLSSPPTTEDYNKAREGNVHKATPLDAHLGRDGAVCARYTMKPELPSQGR